MNNNGKKSKKHEGTKVVGPFTSSILDFNLGDVSKSIPQNIIDSMSVSGSYIKNLQEQSQKISDNYLGSNTRSIKYYNPSNLGNDNNIEFPSQLNEMIKFSAKTTECISQMNETQTLMYLDQVNSNQKTKTLSILSLFLTAIFIVVTVISIAIPITISSRNEEASDIRADRIVNAIDSVNMSQQGIIELRMEVNSLKDTVLKLKSK